MNLTIISSNGKDWISGRELESELGIAQDFTNWFKAQVERTFIQEGKDFTRMKAKSTGGRPSIDYLVTIEASKRIAIVSHTKESKRIIDYLLDLETKIENKDLLNEREILLLSSLIGFFKYLENQIKVYEKHKQQFVEETKTKNNPYAEFHIMRNRILQIDKQLIEKNLQVYCIEQNKRFPKLSTTRDKILFMDAYDGLKNAVWDFLHMNGMPTALKMATIAKNMAKAQGLDLFEHNEENIFQTKELMREPKMIPA